MKRMTALFLPVLFIWVANVHALPPAAAEYGLAWSDEFDGTSLDTINNWSYDTASLYAGEMMQYTRSCVTLENGSLAIWSKYVPNSTTPFKYRSGWIDSHDKKFFTYGYFEASIKAPLGQISGPGLWSTVWLLGNSINPSTGWPAWGVLELYDQRPSDQVLPTISPMVVPSTFGDNEFIVSCNYKNANGSPSYHKIQHDYAAALSDRFHTYGVLWDSLHVEYYFDDTLFWGVNFPVIDDAANVDFGVPDINLPENQVAFHSPFYWVINIVVGGAYQGYNVNNAIFPTKMELDYVRVYQKGAVTAAGKGAKGQQNLRPFVLVNPSTAQLKIYDLQGKLISDFSGRLKSMRPGDAVTKAMGPALRGGVYVAKLVDNGKCLSRKFVAAR